MKVRGYVEETLVVVKEVEVEVPDGAEDDVVQEAIRSKAYEECIIDDKYSGHGWEGADCLNVDIRWVEYVQCPYCKKERLDDPESCPHCGRTPGTCAP